MLFQPNCNSDFFLRSPEEEDLSDNTLQTALGGPIKKDKAWFFLSFAQIDSFTAKKTFSGDLVDNSANIDSQMAKLNFQPSQSHSLSASYIGTPLDLNFIIAPPTADKYARPSTSSAAELLNFNWNWSYSSNIFLETKIAQQTSDENKFLNAGDGSSLESALAEKQQEPSLPAQPGGGTALAWQQFRRLLRPSR